MEKPLKKYIMNNAIYNFKTPHNEPVYGYLKGSKERIELEKELKRQSQIVLDIPLIIGGKEIRTGAGQEQTRACFSRQKR